MNIKVVLETGKELTLTKEEFQELRNLFICCGGTTNTRVSCYSIDLPKMSPEVKKHININNV